MYMTTRHTHPMITLGFAMYYDYFTIPFVQVNKFSNFSVYIYITSIVNMRNVSIAYYIKYTFRTFIHIYIPLSSNSKYNQTKKISGYICILKYGDFLFPKSIYHNIKSAPHLYLSVRLVKVVLHFQYLYPFFIS